MSMLRQFAVLQPLGPDDVEHIIGQRSMYDPSRVCLTPSAVESRASIIRNDPERAALLWLNLELFVRQLSEDIALLQQLAGVPR